MQVQSLKHIVCYGRVVNCLEEFVKSHLRIKLFSLCCFYQGCLIFIHKWLLHMLWSKFLWTVLKVSGFGTTGCNDLVDFLHTVINLLWKIWPLHSSFINKVHLNDWFDICLGAFISSYQWLLFWSQYSVIRVGSRNQLSYDRVIIWLDLVDWLARHFIKKHVNVLFLINLQSFKANWNMIQYKIWPGKEVGKKLTLFKYLRW